MLGLLINDLGRKEDAINDYTKAIEINPLEYKAYHDRGRYHHQHLLGNLLNDLGRKEEALKDHSKAIEINP